jgi:sugar lactone lactonase YvrE
VPVSGAGVPGPSRTLAVSGPVAVISGDLNLNGIAVTPDGQTLIVAHSGTGQSVHDGCDQRYQRDPRRGQRAFVDGIVLEAGRLWAVQNFSIQVTRTVAANLARLQHHDQ